MKYMGSKSRLSKYIVPIIQNEINTNGSEYYLEPFVGGANIIDKIQCKNKIGYDINKYLIALLKQAQIDISVFPKTITEEEYYNVKYNKENYPDWYVGLVGFCATFSAKFFDGYARDKKTERDIPNEGIRNIIKQAPNLKNIKFEVKNYLDINEISGYTIYADPPYFDKESVKYKYPGIEKLNEENFWNWCRKFGKNNVILISNYSAPDDFKCVFEKQHRIFSKNTENPISIERLYKYEQS